MTRQIRIYAGGRLRSSPFQAAWDHYIKQMRLYHVQVREVADAHWPDLLREKNEHWIVLCERAQALDSQQWALRLQQWTASTAVPCFLIGRADGIPQPIRVQADESFSFGPMTWPHIFVRVMLLEQLYRAQQRAAGHPYSHI